VRNLDNGREVIVKITDRGPFINGRIIDISEVAARDIGILVKGLCQAEIQPLN
jgi:rare lipoprotein A